MCAIKRVVNVLVLLMFVLPVAHSSIFKKVFRHLIPSSSKIISPTLCSLCKCTKKTTDCYNLSITVISNGTFINSTMEKVVLQRNHIGILNQNTFEGGDHVRELDVSFNRLKTLGSSSFYCFRELDTLNLAHNDITKLSSKDFDGLKSLTELNIGYNKIINIDDHVFLPCKSLHNLYLNFNKFLGRKSMDYLKVESLYHLDLSNTGIRLLTDDTFQNNSKLEVLILSQNFLKTLPSKALRVLQNLRRLDISFNLIEDLPTKAFYGLEALRDLHMNNLNIHYLREGVFDGLLNLRSLHCSYNYRLSTLHRWAFLGHKNIQKLTEVHLKSNRLRRLFEDTLPWSDLNVLDLRDNPWNCDCDIEWISHLSMPKEFSSEVRCSSPPYLKGIPLKSVSSREFICETGINYSGTISVIFMSCVFALISLTVIVFLVFKFKICSRLRASKQQEYVVFSNEGTVEIKLDEKDSGHVAVMYGGKDIDVHSDDEETDIYNPTNSKTSV